METCLRAATLVTRDVVAVFQTINSKIKNSHDFHKASNGMAIDYTIVTKIMVVVLLTPRSLSSAATLLPYATEPQLLHTGRWGDSYGIEAVLVISVNRWQLFDEQSKSNWIIKALEENRAQ